MKTIKLMAGTFLRNEHGFIITSEFLLSATITVLGLLVGIANVRNSLLYELNEIGAVIGKLNQSYSYTGVTQGDPQNGGPTTQGGLFTDSFDGLEDTGTTYILTEGPMVDPNLDPTLGGEQ